MTITVQPVWRSFAPKYLQLRITCGTYKLLDMGATRRNYTATINAPSAPCILCNDRYDYCKWEGSPSPTAAAGFYFLVQGTLKSSSLFSTQYCASSSSTRTKRPSAKSNSLSEQNWSVLQDIPETISLLTHGMVLSQLPWASDDFQTWRISANLLWRSSNAQGKNGTNPT